MKLIMENWRKHLKELVKLTAPGSEEPDPEVYGDYMKDRPRGRKALSIMARDVEEGIAYLEMNMDNIAANMERDPNYDPEPEQQQLFTMATQLENGLARATSTQGSGGGLSEEDRIRLDAKIKDFKQNVLSMADTIDVRSPLQSADTLDVKQVAEITRKFVRLMAEINKWQDQK